jgi:hypothetical protein
MAARKTPSDESPGATQLLGDYAAGLDAVAMGHIAGLPRGGCSSTHAVRCSPTRRRKPSPPRTRSVSEMRPQPTARWCRTGVGFGLEHASLLHGMSAHECGIDDFHAPSRTHPGAAVVRGCARSG